MISETRDRELKAFLNEQAELGGVHPSRLPGGTEIWIATDRFMYKLTVDRSMGMPKFIIDTGSTLVPKDRTCIEVNSHCQRLRHDMKDWVGKGMRLILNFSDGSNILSGEIIGATIVGTDSDGEDYEYELWQ